MKPDGNAYVVRNEKQLAALASSARPEIVDVLSQMGTVSVAELASALGRPADSLYYHLKVLKEIGLVVTGVSILTKSATSLAFWVWATVVTTTSSDPNKNKKRIFIHLARSAI
jgi:predicted transcriptional regulator